MDHTNRFTDAVIFTPEVETAKDLVPAASRAEANAKINEQHSYAACREMTPEEIAEVLNGVIDSLSYEASREMTPEQIVEVLIGVFDSLCKDREAEGAKNA